MSDDPTVRELAIVMAERDRLYSQRFADLDKANTLALTGVREMTAAALMAAKEAVTKAENSNEKRFDAVNEFRGQLKDVIGTLTSKDEVMVRFKSFEDRLTLVASQQTLTRGQSEGAHRLWALLVGAIGVGLGVLAAVTLR